jgi:hypothetical protein
MGALHKDFIIVFGIVAVAGMPEDRINNFVLL